MHNQGFFSSRFGAICFGVCIAQTILAQSSNLANQPPTPKLLLVVSHEAETARKLLKQFAVTDKEIGAPKGWILWRQGSTHFLFDENVVVGPLGSAHLLAQQLISRNRGAQVIHLDELPPAQRQAIGAIMTDCGLGPRTMRALLGQEGVRAGVSPSIQFEVTMGGKTIRSSVAMEPEGFYKDCFTKGITTKELQDLVQQNPTRYDGDEVERKVTAQREVHWLFNSLNGVEAAFDLALKQGMEKLLELRTEQRERIQKGWQKIIDDMLAASGVQSLSREEKFESLDQGMQDALRKDFLSKAQQYGFVNERDALSALENSTIRLVGTSLMMTISRLIAPGTDSHHVQRFGIRF